MSQLTNQQSQILKFFEDADQQIVYEPIRQIYLNPIPEIVTQIYETQPLILQIDYNCDDDNIDQMHRKLAIYKEKSKIVEEVGSMIYDYDKNFRNMIQQRDYLTSVISELNKQTSELVDRQKKFIDLSIAVKQSLDYYTFIDKFEFNWSCEISYRDMFEDQLQPIVSQLTDAIQFFSTNSHFTNSKKYLSIAVSHKTKVTSFIKSFFIKLLNKQYSHSFKNTKSQLWQYINYFYPKSKLKIIHAYLSVFPQFHNSQKDIILMTKDSASEQQISSFQNKELQIQEFQMNQSSLSLVKYLQKNIPEIYEEAILKFISYYRINYHENIHKSMKIDSSISFEQSFRQCYIQCAFMIASQAAYLVHMFRPSNQSNKQFLRNTLVKIAQFYKVLLGKYARDPSKNKNPLVLCNLLNNINDQIHKFFDKYMSGQYEAYIFGAVCKNLHEIGVDFVKNIILSIGHKIKSDLQNVCHNFLPKFKFSSDQQLVTQQVTQFVQMIPNLQYCSQQAEQYVVSSLDTLIKSIKQTSHKLQSRVESYAWNLEIFAALEDAINKKGFKLIKKQMRLEMNEASTLVDRMKGVQRGQNILQYTSQLFSVLKTGVPTLNQLTLDFKKFIGEYHSQLRQKFVKDMVFIHAKNIIEFMQKLKEANEQQAKTLCEFSLLRNLYNSYVLSIKNFIKQSKMILQQRKKFNLFYDGEKNLKKMIEQVQQVLVDLMSAFYIECSKINSETQSFESITDIRKIIDNTWKEDQNKKQ